MKAENVNAHEKLSRHGLDFSEKLACWFGNNARELPWRQQPTPYKTVVSELMLQQTQVVTVLPYFDRWMKALSDFQALARAKEDRILKLWEGLGYYRRARNLHKLAQRWVLADPKPRTFKEWLDYPGVGPYTAAAIASIAFGEHAAVVDGNVVRILARLTADDTVFKDSGTAVKHFTPLANALIVNAERPGPHNEAMMELGATVCLKAKPLCLLCPVSHHCSAYTQGSPEVFPKLQRKASTHREIRRLWVLKNDKLLLHRKAADSTRLAGLYELPEAEALTQKKIWPEPLAIKKRGIANERIEERIYAYKTTSTLSRKVALDGHYTWVGLDQLEAITMTGPHRKWINELLTATAKPALGCNLKE